MSLALLAALASASRARVLPLDPASPSYDLTPFVDVLVDQNRSLSFEDILGPKAQARFVPFTGRSMHFGITRAAVWLRFSLAPAGRTNAAQISPQWVLDFGARYLYHFWLYLPKQLKPGEPASNGWAVLYTEDPERGWGARPREDLLSLRLPRSGGPFTLYIRVHTKGSLYLPLRLVQLSHFNRQDHWRLFGHGVYFGLVAALALYNFFLFIILKDRNYFFYVLYVLFVAGYVAALSGVAWEAFFAGHMHLQHVCALLSIGLGIVCATMFSRSFLDTKRRSPLADKLLLAYLAAAVVMVAITPFVDGIIISHFSSYMGLVGPMIILGAGFSVWRKGFAPARYYLMAWLFFTAGGLVYSLTYRGVIPLTSLGLNSLQIGASLEAVLLSLALADRIQALRLQREEARQAERRALRLAVTDQLSGLYNARYFWSQLEMEMARMEQLKLPLALLLLDVDNFKHYNDTHGHLEGDKVLSRLGDIIRESIRDHDHGCRYGGEEFAVILPGSTAAQAAKVAERIRQSLAWERFRPGGQGVVSITVSIGASEMQKGQTAKQLAVRADQALYQAKEQGKDRVIAA